MKSAETKITDAELKLIQQMNTQVQTAQGQLNAMIAMLAASYECGPEDKFDIQTGTITRKAEEQEKTNGT